MQPAPGTFLEVSVPDALTVAAGRTIIDVRELVEWNEGHIPTAVLVPLADFTATIETVVPDKGTPVLVHCAVGARSRRAAAYMAQLGYTNVLNIQGRLAEWKALGGAWEMPAQVLTDAERARYSRQILIPEIGQEGQRRLLDAKVLLIGAGGLGSPAGLYLAAAGIGTLGIVDDDVVDESNLQRQVLHTADRVGMPKTESAERTLTALNPGVHIVRHPVRLDESNVEELVAAYDVIVDGTDNFETRYLLNDVSVAYRKPVVHGSIYRWDGQVTTFVPFDGPCYRCLYPTQPPEELAPACAVAGVLGVLPGIIGLLQSNEVVKLVLGVGETLAGRMLLFDAMSTSFDEIRLWRDPACPACGDAVARPADPVATAPAASVAAG
jgi:molybdopterin/thiamine biosynthesis adenylyltransferase/rhodanese-related sulfurtransferase